MLLQNGLKMNIINKLMKSEDEIRKYLNTHYFINRIHAHAVRAVLIDKFKTTKFDLKITSTPQIEYEDIAQNIITASEAIDYIWGKPK